eukprot:1559168-Prymnesium_polylepis.1
MPGGMDPPQGAVLLYLGHMHYATPRTAHQARLTVVVEVRRRVLTQKHAPRRGGECIALKRCTRLPQAFQVSHKTTHEHTTMVPSLPLPLSPPPALGAPPPPSAASSSESGIL